MKEHKNSFWCSHSIWSQLVISYEWRALACGRIICLHKTTSDFSFNVLWTRSLSKKHINKFLNKMLSSKFKCDKELHTSLKAQTSISQHWFTETEGFIILHRNDAYEVILHACKGPTSFEGLQVHRWETSSDRGAKGCCILTETISNDYLPESALSAIDCTRFVVYIYKACDSTVSVVWRQTAGTSSSGESKHRLLHEKRASGKMALRRNQSLWKSAHVGDVLRSDTSRADTSGHEGASQAAALVLASKGLCKPSLVSYLMYTIVTI